MPAPLDPKPLAGSLAAGSLSAGKDRPIPLRRRADLTIVPQWFGGRRWFVVKDPVALKFFHLTEEEHAILTLLDGQASPAAIKAQFERQFAPRRLSPERLQAFFVELHRRGLVLADAVGQGTELAQRRSRREQRGLLSLAERLLVIRFRGINPQALLDWLQPRFGWLLDGRGFLLWALLIASAAGVLLSRGSELARRVPDVQHFLTPANLGWLGIALILVKTLHELGHALAARRFGCSIPEMGVQLFFFLPCLYTNVSDSWLLPSKWQRMAVSAAGIYVELALASLALLLWWAAEPGALASICFSIMVVASVGTLVLNGNPLMRYDGYYLLSDFVEVPNLEARSRRQLLGWLAETCLGAGGQEADPTEHQSPLLAIYALAALIYRAVVLVGMYVALRTLLAPWSLEPAGDILLVAAVIGLVVPLLSTLGQSLMQAHRERQFRPQRLLVTCGVAIALLAAALFVPLPQRVIAPAMIEPRDARGVYVPVAGTLQSAAKPGEIVRRGDVLARLESPELARDLARLEAERRAQVLHLTHLETLRAANAADASAIPAAQEAIADLDARISQVQSLAARLTLVAPCDGIVLPPPVVNSKSTSIQLAAWSGTPLDRENRGSFLTTGTLVGLVAPAEGLTALAIVEQSDVALVEPGASARLVLPQASGGAIAGTVEEVSRLEVDRAPAELLAAGLIPVATNATGAAQPVQTAYQVRIALKTTPRDAIAGQVARVAIAAPAQPLATRIARWLGDSFRFGM